MDQQFFYEVTREIADIEDTNSYLQAIAEENKKAKADEDYFDFIQAMLRACYEEYEDGGFVW
jgi:hypothetical protein